MLADVVSTDECNKGYRPDGSTW